MWLGSWEVRETHLRLPPEVHNCSHSQAFVSSLQLLSAHQPTMPWGKCSAVGFSCTPPGAFEMTEGLKGNRGILTVLLRQDIEVLPALLGSPATAAFGSLLWLLPMAAGDAWAVTTLSTQDGQLSMQPRSLSDYNLSLFGQHRTLTAGDQRLR